jgi:hypothetical protein
MYFPTQITEGKKKRGRPKKIFDKLNKEETVYDNFFQDLKRKKIPSEVLNISKIVKYIFEKLFLNKEYNLSKLKTLEEHPILHSILNPIKNKKDKKKTCDEIFISYINLLTEKSNNNYILFSLTVILLLRECINKYRNIELEDKLEITGEKNNVKLANFTEVCEGEQIPEILNEFITEFLPSFKFFGLNFLNNFSEIKSLIQHFCFWLYENNYTSSKLIINKNKK